MAISVMLEIARKLFNQNFSHLAYFYFLGTIDHYHFIPLSISVMLTIAKTKSHMVNEKQNMSVSFSRTIFKAVIVIFSYYFSW